MDAQIGVLVVNVRYYTSLPLLLLLGSFLKNGVVMITL
jgi:hypothetical protein